MFKGLSQSSGAETIIDNRLRKPELVDPVGRRAGKEKRRGKVDRASGSCRLLGLSGSAMGRRTWTVSGGSPGDIGEETLLRRGLISITLGLKSLSSFLTRPPNRLTLLRKVRLLTETFAAAG